ncbi:MerR family transcriptional regulator [Nocardia sp. NBC_01327]|uniref:MerR family transcriptional regulator n=1 Tax=Nocardia sp. NBC_01327 TaxID=2903593 RepID=UPI002E1669FB|nr:MerR family transcriptional regulator [Nocardia sp. NBC_01327]
MEYTIDELARVADTRSVRVYHERGLLQSPDVRGRIGYYDSDHLNRLQTISRLLSRGMKLNGIRELLEAFDRGDGLADVLGVPDQPEVEVPTAVTAPAHSPELPEYLRKVLASSEDPIEGYRLANPRCSDLATRLADAGLPASDACGLIERLRSDCDQIADRYAPDLYFQLAGTHYAQSPRSPRDQSAFETNVAIARLIATRAAAELIDQAFARYGEHPLTRPA